MSEHRCCGDTRARLGGSMSRRRQGRVAECEQFSPETERSTLLGPDIEDRGAHRSRRTPGSGADRPRTPLALELASDLDHPHGCIRLDRRIRAVAVDDCTCTPELCAYDLDRRGMRFAQVGRQSKPDLAQVGRVSVPPTACRRRGGVPPAARDRRRRRSSRDRRPTTTGARAPSAARPRSTRHASVRTVRCGP
jgi:hypothetical protein